MSFWYPSAGSLPAPPVQNPTPLSCPCFKLPLFYDCKWLELKCYQTRRDRAPWFNRSEPTHTAWHATQPQLGGTVGSVSGSWNTSHEQPREIVPLADEIQTSDYARLLFFFFFFKKRCLSHINDKTNFSVLLTRCCTVSCCQKELSLMRWFSWWSSSLVHEQVPNKTARTHLTPASKGCWGGNISGAKGLELPHYKQSQKSLNPFGNTITEFHF